MDEINELSSKDFSERREKIAKSIKYQVLCDDTAFVGVLKQVDKTTGVLKETNVDFTKISKPQPVQPQSEAS